MLPGYPRLYAFLNNLGRQRWAASADKRARIVRRLKQPGHEGQAIVADRFSLRFQPDVVAIRQVEALPPGTLFPFSSKFSESQPVFVINLVKLTQPRDVSFARTSAPVLESTDLGTTDP